MQIIIIVALPLNFVDFDPINTSIFKTINEKLISLETTTLQYRLANITP